MNNTLILNPPFIFDQNLNLRWKIGLRVFWLFGILLVTGLLVFYIFQVNAEVSERYSIQEQEKRLSEISKENQNLEINSVQIISLSNITPLLEELNFEKVNKIHYIRVLDSQVVTK